MSEIAVEEIQEVHEDESHGENSGKGKGSKKGSKTGSKIFAGIVAGLIVALVTAYIMIAQYYGTHFLPGTVINGIACGNADKSAALDRLVIRADDYRLEILGRNPKIEIEKLLTISGQDIEYIRSAQEEAVDGLLAGQNIWLWPVYLWKNGDQYTVQGIASWNEEKLEQILRSADIFQKNKMIAPKNAYLKGYSEAEKQFVITPETEGTVIDLDKAFVSVKDALTDAKDELNLEDIGSYVKAAVTADAPKLQRELEKANKWLDTKILYDWNGTQVEVSGERIKDWIILENDTVSLDEEKVAQFVAESAKENDTYRKTRTFHTTRGYDLDLPGGAFGWLTDKEAETAELINLIQSGNICEREPVYASTAPVKGKNDIGSSYVEIDMTFQHLYLYQKGEIVLETDFVSGNMSNGNRTPPGVFGLTYKTRNATLRGANYASFVHYWMPFNGNIGMHDATWRSVFGGRIYETSGSHGCINLPLNKAAEIYPYMSTGFPIICYYYPDGVLSEEDLAALAAIASIGETVDEQDESTPIVVDDDDDDD